MARYRKSYEQQLNALNQQISKVQDKLDALIEQRELVLQKKREKRNYLSCIMYFRRTVDEVLVMIQDNEAKTA